MLKTFVLAFYMNPASTDIVEDFRITNMNFRTDFYTLKV